MAITALYVDTSAGANTNGGSGEGSAIVSGTDADTFGGATVSLSGPSPDLSGVSVGDSIRIAGQTAGQGNSSDIFEITAVDDGADTVDVTPSPAFASNQAWAIGGAFATIDKAFNVVKAGDKVWIKASATYNESPDIVTGGGVNTEIVFEGYTSSIGDGGQITVTGRLTDTTATNIQYCFANFIIDATGEGQAVYFSSIEITWRNCVFKNATGVGIQTGSTNCFYECEFLDNGNDGAMVGSRAIFINCKFYRNAVSAIDCSGGVACYNCVFFSNGTYAIDAGAANESTVLVFNCTIDGDSKDTSKGITINGSYRGCVCVINTIVYDCTTGIESFHGDRDILVHNLLNANTADYAGDASDQEGGVSAAPQFVDEVAGADYSLEASSPAKGTGTDYSADNMDMGAIQTGAGGGLLMPNKRAGKQ